jgi:hypothetical protein
MEKIINIGQAKEKILSDMNKFINNIRRFTEKDISSLSDGLVKLRNIRSSVYENLNQIQHEYLILQWLLWLSKNGFNQPEIHWYWNPRQTGDTEEPDLRATVNGKIVLSAEATTSENPQGVIDSRMRDTLIKLNQMEGSKYYFIRTTAMENRAHTKVAKSRLNVEVVKIES